jgi:hypothetical protein
VPARLLTSAKWPSFVYPKSCTSPDAKLSLLHQVAVGDGEGQQRVALPVELLD